MSPPFSGLAHDHRELSGLLVAVHEALERIAQGKSQLDDELHELTDGLEAFRETLLLHFAQEQEGVFPWVATRLPERRADVDQLLVEHDRIAATLTQVLKDLPGGDLAPFRAALDRFEALYAEHTQSENRFFGDVATALAGDPDATAELRALWNGR